MSEMTLKSLVLMAALSLMSGCSINRVLNSPPPLDVEKVKAGENRQTIISVLGEPVSTDVSKEGRSDRYEFVSGYSAKERERNIVIYLLGDIFTYGLTEFYFNHLEKKCGSVVAGQGFVEYGMEDIATSVKLVRVADGQPWGDSPPEPPPQQYPPLKVDPPRIVPPDGKITLVVQGDVKLKILDSSLSSATGRGAASGAAAVGTVGGYLGQACGPVAFICMPAGALGGAIVGSIGGAVFGLIMAEPASTWEKAAIISLEVMAGKDSRRLFAEELVSFANQHGYEIILKETHGPEIAEESVKGEKFSTLEIHNITVSLMPVQLDIRDIEIHPMRRVTPRTFVRLVEPANGSVLVEVFFMDESGLIRPIEEWMADDAKLLRSEVAGALPRLARTVVTELFMLQQFQPRTIDHSSLQEMVLWGMRPIQPQMKLSWRKDDVSETTRTPTLQWESFPGNDVTYDLRIWPVDSKVVFLKGNIDMVGDIGLNLEGLTEPSYTLETPLEPSKTYYWSVRAHFETDGKQQVTDWSRVEFGKIGVYYKFRTSD